MDSKSNKPCNNQKDKKEKNEGKNWTKKITNTRNDKDKIKKKNGKTKTKIYIINIETLNVEP